ncbi:concanavalin A-like lectin/glucanase [Leptospira sp. 96542]|nr:concanavalin A-like lectin/glucanase [Leptospira sp. 96542]
MDRNRIRRRTSSKTVGSYRKTILIIVFCGFLPTFASQVPKKESLNLQLWKKSGASFHSVLGKKSHIKPKENTPNFGELFFDFEGDVGSPETTESETKFVSKAISLVSSSYIVDEKTAFFGGQSAFFSGRRNQIHLSVFGNSLFGTRPEPFSITVPIRINEQGTNSVILDRTVFVKGKKYGFSLELIDNKPTLSVNNLIQKTNQRTKSFQIFSDTKIKRKEWEVLSIYFDTISNKTILYLNGKEEGEYEYNTHDTIGFGFPENDSTSLVLAKSFYGNIDGFHIHKGMPIEKYTKYQSVLYDDSAKTAEQPGVWVVSPILETKFSNSVLSNVNYEAEIPDDTMIEIYFRGQNQKFTETNHNLNWVRVSKNVSSLPKEKFKYHQWKVWLRPNPAGSKIPNLQTLSFEYTEQTPPMIPTMFRLDPKNNNGNSVCFLWNSNHEKEVQNGGGYIIHYGLTPNRMIGSIFVKKNIEGKFFKLDGKEENSGFRNLKHCITTENLISNIYIPDGELESEEFKPLADPSYASRKEKMGHLFQSGLTYYFKISAYNHYLNEWDSRDQISEVSKPISFSFPKEISNR